MPPFEVISPAGMASIGGSLLQRSENIRLIPGTSAVSHLRENVAGAALTLSGDDLADLGGIAS